MIPVARVPEPAGFDEQVRKRGNQWLAEYPDAERPRDYWSPFREVLAEGFKQLCGYAAMQDFSGTVDHFHAFKTHPALAYEWSNYRYATGWVNSGKKGREMLDPYEVQDGWFVVILPSMQLVMTDKAPPEIRRRMGARGGMLEWLNGERFKKLRLKWYRQYAEAANEDQRRFQLDQLRKSAPLIAEAIERELSSASEQQKLA